MGHWLGGLVIVNSELSRTLNLLEIESEPI